MPTPDRSVARLSRRGVLAGGLGIAATGLAGCGSSNGPALRATWWGDPNLNAAVRKAIDAFERSPHGTRISSEFLPWDGYWDKLATQTAGKSEPDLIMHAGTYLPEYVPRQVLLDLDSYIGAPLRLSGIDAGVRHAGAYDGGTYAVIAAINSPTVMFNRKLLRTSGVEPPDHTWSWTELERMCSRVRRVHGHSVYGVQDAGGDLIAFQVWIRQRGKELFDQRDRLAITADDLFEWLTFWEELRAKGSAPPAALTAETSGDLTLSPIVKGQAAFAIGWNQDLAAIAALTEDDLGLTMFPGRPNGRNGQWLNAASMWAASAHTAQPEQVAQLIDFLVNDDAAIDAVEVWLGVPPLARARDRIRGNIDATARLSLDYIELVERHSRPLQRLWPAGFTELRDLLPRLSEDVGFGERSISDAVEQFFSETERVLT